MYVVNIVTTQNLHITTQRTIFQSNEECFDFPPFFNEKYVPIQFFFILFEKNFQSKNFKREKEEKIVHFHYMLKKCLVFSWYLVVKPMI